MSEKFFNTHEVSKILQVDNSTVKRWSDEGKLVCFRTPGGHRKFHAEDLYSFVMKYNYKYANNFLESYLVSDEVIIKKIITKNEYHILQSVIMDSAIKGNKNEVLKVFKEAFYAGLSFAKTLDVIFEPALKKLYDLHVSQKLTHYEFQLAMNVLSSSLVLVEEFVSKKDMKRKTILCASLENGKNEIGLIALVSLLETLGYRVLNLGSAVNADEVNALMTKEHPSYVCLFSSFVQHPQNYKDEFTKIISVAEKMQSQLIVGPEILIRTLQTELVQTNNTKVYEKYSDFEKIEEQINANDFIQKLQTLK